MPESAKVVIVRDNTMLVSAGIERALKKAIATAAYNTEAGAKRRAPVDTGNLRDSITTNIASDGKSAEVGTNVEYAPYVEFGTVHQAAQPYLLPAFADAVKELRDTVEGVIGGEVRDER